MTAVGPEPAQTGQARHRSDRPLRVALVSDGIYPYFKGGKEVRIHQLLRRVAASGVDVHVYTMKWWDGPRVRRDEGITYHAICRNWPMYAGQRRSLMQAAMFGLACFRLVVVKADVIDADHMPYVQLLPLKLISLVRRIPLVVTWHEWWGSDYWNSYLGRIGMVASAVEKVTARMADRLVADAPGTADRVAGSGVDPARISVLSCGVDRAVIDGCPPAQEGPDLVFVGRLLEHKGAHVLLESLLILRSREVTPTCTILGDGPERQRLMDLVQTGDLGDQVTFVDRLESQEDVFSLIKSARCFVLPTIREGFGLAVAEALACGTQVVTTDHPDNQAQYLIVEGVNGHLARPDATAFADAIEVSLSQAVDKDAVRSTIVERDWDTLAPRLVEIYEGMRR